MKTTICLILTFLLCCGFQQLGAYNICVIEVNGQSIRQQLSIRKDKREYTPPSKRKYITKQTPTVPKKTKSPFNKNKAVPLQSTKTLSK